MNLYHAVSVYQILTCATHRLCKGNGDKNVLVLQDFIVNKYQEYQLLQKLKIFDEIYIFPFSIMRKCTTEAGVFAKIDSAYEKAIPYEIEKFDKIYVAGAQFYFSYYLIKHNINFDFFEEASGFLLDNSVLLNATKQSNFLLYELGIKYGLLDGSCPLINHAYGRLEDGIIYTDKRYVNFNLQNELANLDRETLQNLRLAFGYRPKERISLANVTVFATQHFANLSMMDQADEEEMYELLIDYVFTGENIVIKPHPDDVLPHRYIFPDIEILPSLVPIELLVDSGRQGKLVTVNSTVINNFPGETISLGDDFISRYRELHTVYAAHTFAVQIQDYFDEYYADSYLMELLRLFSKNFTYENMEPSFSAKGRSLYLVKNIDSDIVKQMSEYDVAISEHINYQVYKEEFNCIISKPLHIFADDETSQIRQLFFLVRRPEVCQCVMDFSYIKKLRYAKGVVIVEKTEESYWEKEALQGLLEATEKRLESTLEENRMLRDCVQSLKLMRKLDDESMSSVFANKNG